MTGTKRVVTSGVAVLLALSAARGAMADSLVVNGDFQKWTAGAPDDWTVEIGATNGAQDPKSEVKLITGPALMLRGSASTMAWHSVSQQIAARPGSTYRLVFESRTKDIKQEGRQFNNCYVGFMAFDKSGNVAGRKSQDASADKEWTRHEVDFTVPPGTAATNVTIFLSKSGLLAVRNVAVTAAPTDGTSPSAPASTPAATEFVVNGDFSRWTDAVPDGWKVEIGATNGANEPTSEIVRLDKDGLALQGQASTLAWYSAGQKLPLENGKTYTLAFQAQAQNIRREGRQYDNCYVGVMSFDDNGQRLDMSVEDLSQVSRWKEVQIHFRVPGNAASTELLIFLSKSGTLSVKNVSVKEATPDRPFRRSSR